MKKLTPLQREFMRQIVQGERVYGEGCFGLHANGPEDCGVITSLVKRRLVAFLDVVQDDNDRPRTTKTRALRRLWLRVATAKEDQMVDDEKLRTSLRLAVRWMGDPSDPLGTFEDIAEWFYQDTGFLRPGKSEPLECGDRHEEREKAWNEWTKRTRVHVLETCRAALDSGADGAKGESK